MCAGSPEEWVNRCRSVTLLRHSGIRAVIPFGNVARNRQIEPQAACLNLHGYKRCGDDGFRQRSGVVDRVRRNRWRGCVIRLPAKRVNEKLTLIANRQHAAGECVIRDRAVEHAVCGFQLRIV